jgi:hypothetical protein
LRLDSQLFSQPLRSNGLQTLCPNGASRRGKCRCQWPSGFSSTKRFAQSRLRRRPRCRCGLGVVSAAFTDPANAHHTPGRSWVGGSLLGGPQVLHPRPQGPSGAGRRQRMSRCAVLARRQVTSAPPNGKRAAGVPERVASMERSVTTSGASAEAAGVSHRDTSGARRGSVSASPSASQARGDPGEGRRAGTRE